MDGRRSLPYAAARRDDEGDAIFAVCVRSLLSHVTDSDTPTVQPVVGNHFTTMFQFVTPKALRAQ